MLDSNDVLKAKEEAASFVNRVGLDGSVRTIAKAGNGDSARINYVNTWEDANVSATFGAGTNTASVKLADGTILYQAHQYGQHLEIFRMGAWVERLMAEARRISKANERERYLEKRAAIEDESGRFSPIDY
jgi:hypothetical protein